MALALTTLAATSAPAAESYLFGRSADDGLGFAQQSRSGRYAIQYRDVGRQGYRALSDDYGSLVPTELRILIKDDAYATPLTQTFVDTLSREKSNLMRLYKISNQDYNRLAAIAFGILGKETKFGKSVWYHFKEANQQPISVSVPIIFPGVGLRIIPTPLQIPSVINMRKLQKKKTRDLGRAISQGDAGLFLDIETWHTPPNSRGLTQIKSIPQAIRRFYCVNAEQLGSPQVAAVATLGFLAESLRITKTRVRNRGLSYVTDENIFDYVLYVYFGSIRQLADPRYEWRFLEREDTSSLVTRKLLEYWNYVKPAPAGPPRLEYAPVASMERVQANETATPERNVYIRYVKRYIGALALFENEGRAIRGASNNACRVPTSPTK